ncbi:unnamed protein product [Adineta ricciae]|uniref:Uncharacterized protein n=1 Tax=Adineta ricciae TaxID=249248 RepID=A0A815S4D9_ADIRI|nr:unnamed protein product [Adineta ricciae]
MALNEKVFENPPDYDDLRTTVEPSIPPLELASYNLPSLSRSIEQGIQADEISIKEKCSFNCLKWIILVLSFILIGLLILCIVLIILFVMKSRSTNNASAILTATSTTTTTTTTITTTTLNPSCVTGKALITFDDLSLKSQELIPNGYRNINWDNADIALSSDPAIGGSGMVTVMISGNAAAFNERASALTIKGTNGSRFTLYSGAFAAVWSDNLQLQVVGYRSNTIIANNIYTLQVFNVSYITFDGYSRLDSVVFSTSAGTHNLDVVGSGRHFGMDNLCLTFP